MLYQSGEYELFPETSVSNDDNKKLLDTLAKLRRRGRLTTKENIINAIHDDGILLMSSLDSILDDLLLRGVIGKSSDEYFIIMELYYEHMKWREELRL